MDWVWAGRETEFNTQANVGVRVVGVTSQVRVMAEEALMYSAVTLGSIDASVGIRIKVRMSSLLAQTRYTKDNNFILTRGVKAFSL